MTAEENLAICQMKLDEYNNSSWIKKRVLNVKLMVESFRTLMEHTKIHFRLFWEQFFSGSFNFIDLFNWMILPFISTLLLPFIVFFHKKLLQSDITTINGHIDQHNRIMAEVQQARKEL